MRENEGKGKQSVCVTYYTVPVKHSIEISQCEELNCESPLKCQCDMSQQFCALIQAVM